MSAGKKREQTKSRKHGEAVKASGYIFHPCVFETTGFIPPRSRSFLKMILSSNIVPGSIDSILAMRQISCCLQKGNALVMRAGLIAARMSATKFQTDTFFSVS